MYGSRELMNAWTRITIAIFKKINDTSKEWLNLDYNVNEDEAGLINR